MLAGHWGFCLDHCCAVMAIKASLDFLELWAGKELKRIQTEACFLSRNSQSGCTYTMQCKSKKILHGCMYLRLCAHVCAKKMSKSAFSCLDTVQVMCANLRVSYLCFIVCLLPIFDLNTWMECNNHCSQNRLLAQKNFIISSKITNERRNNHSQKEKQILHKKDIAL